MRVLSLFDGISCALVALKRAGISVDEYYASEIDKYAISVSAKNHPEILRLGDVREVGLIPDIDLMIWGSPCQDLSIAKKGRKGLDGERSGLFWEAVRILELNKPKWWVMENVASMSSQDRDTISRTLGVQPVMINASLVSAQNRKRLFWANFPITQPLDKGIILRDILTTNSEASSRSNKMVKIGYIGEGHQYGQGGQAHRVYADVGKSPTLGSSGCLVLGYIGNTNSQGNRVYSADGKSVCLSANGGGGGAKTGLYMLSQDVRKLVPVECERLQGLPDDYTAGISNTQRYKCLGNAFNVDVVAHIFSGISDI